MIEHLKDYVGSDSHIENVKKARVRALEVQQEHKQKRIETYYKEPKLCKGCQTPIDYDKQANTFCSRSCSRTFNNYKRGGMKEEIKQKIRDTVSIKLYGDIGKSLERECIQCKVVFSVKFNSQKCCSDSCLIQHRKELHSSPEYRTKLSNACKQAYVDGRSKGWASRDKMKPSYPEQYFMNMFNRDGIQYEREVKIGRYFADFVFNGDIILEVDGSQHDREPYKSSDIQKDKFLVDQGFQVVRIRWRNVKTVEGYKAIQEQYERFKDIIPSVG